MARRARVRKGPQLIFRPTGDGDRGPAASGRCHDGAGVLHHFSLEGVDRFGRVEWVDLCRIFCMIR